MFVENLMTYIYGSYIFVDLFTHYVRIVRLQFTLLYKETPSPLWKVMQNVRGISMKTCRVLYKGPNLYISHIHKQHVFIHKFPCRWLLRAGMCSAVCIVRKYKLNTCLLQSYVAEIV